MKKPNIVVDKSYAFALSVLRIYRAQANDHTLRPLLIQLVRSATSIGANVHEGIAAESRADVRHKMAIASKEANECVFWLNILHDASCLPPDVYEQCYPLGVERTKILGSINKTLKEKASYRNRVIVRSFVDHDTRRFRRISVQNPFIIPHAQAPLTVVRSAQYVGAR